MNSGNLGDFVDQMLRTRAFQRLRDVSFLGILDRYSKSTSPNAAIYSRADHSVGVLSLALKIASSVRMSDPDAMTLAAAALTHDLAHPAFSHSLEYAFARSERQLDHHTALRHLLFGSTPRALEIARLFGQHGIDPERVYAVVSGEDKLSFFFDCPINIDTLDGITRVMWLNGVMAPYNVALLSKYIGRLYSGETISELAFFREADRFWQEKDGFYNRYLSGARTATESSFQRQVRKSIKNLEPHLFEMSDTEFVRRYPEVICNTSMATDKVPPAEEKQSFEIDEAVSPVDKSSIFKRYRRVRRAGHGFDQYAPSNS